jgi:hypothetical protein
MERVRFNNRWEGVLRWEKRKMEDVARKGVDRARKGEIRAHKGRVDKENWRTELGRLVIELGIGKIELMALGRIDRVRNGEDSSGRGMI